MDAYRSIVLVGASGSVGLPILSALLQRGYDVAVLTHSTEGKTFPPQVLLEETDYSHASLVRVLRGRDAVVCTLGYAVLDRQFDVIAAAEAAGVKRFILGDFSVPKGMNDVSEYAAILGKKAKAAEMLKELAARNHRFTWSTFCNGPFLDRVRGCRNIEVFALSPCVHCADDQEHAFATSPEFGFDVRNQSATLFDTGREPFTAMTINNIGAAVVVLLANSYQTKNRVVDTFGLQTSQLDMLAEFERQTQAKWNVSRARTEDVKHSAVEMQQSGDYKGAYIGFLVAQLFEDGAGRGAGLGLGNALLGVNQETLSDIIEAVLFASFTR